MVPALSACILVILVNTRILVVESITNRDYSEVSRLNIPQSLVNILQKAYKQYHFYLYWRAQERMARRYSSDHLKWIQWKKFKEVLEFAYNHIPFYKDKFRQAGITPESIKKREDLIRIPILSKDEIRQNFPDYLLDNTRKYEPSMIGHTSGSTGESLHFVKPDETWNRSYYYSIFLRTQGIRNVPVLVLTTPRCTPNSCSLHEEDNSRGIVTNKLQRIWFLRHLDEMIGLPSSQNILCASDEYMEHLAEIISYYSPCIMIVDPVYLASFARYLKKNRKPTPRVRKIITTFELLTGSLKDLLHEVFDCDIYTQYGASEINDIANECGYHKLHVKTDTVLVEAIRDGQPVEPGEIGKAIITDLCNYNMPFIRYEIGDVIRPGDGKCRCGSNTDIIESIEGRVPDIIATDDSRLFTPLQIDRIFRGLRGIAAYRFVQQAKNFYRISIMKDDVSDELDKQMLIKRCRSMFGEESHFEIEFVEEITPQFSKQLSQIYATIICRSLDMILAMLSD